MRRRVFVVVGDGGWWCCWCWRWCWRWCWCLCCWWCWWCWCWGRLAGGKLRPLVARVQHSLGLSHAPIAVADLDDAVRGLELLHVPSRLHRALKGITTTGKRTAPKRLEIPARAPTNDRSPRHLEENGKSISAFGLRQRPFPRRSSSHCMHLERSAVPGGVTGSLRVFSLATHAPRYASKGQGAGWLEAPRTHESLPTAAPACDVQCWPPAGSCYCGLSLGLPSRELIALSGLTCRADHFQQCVRTHMYTQHASSPCPQRCHHLRRCCTCLRGVRQWWSR